MSQLTILLIHHDPHPKLLRDEAGKAGLDIDVHVSKSSTDAVDWLLWLSDEIDVIFVCYEMRGGDNTVDSGVISECVYRGFGGGEYNKHLVAFSRDPDEINNLLRSGCNRVCHPDHIAMFLFFEFGGEQVEQGP